MREPFFRACLAFFTATMIVAGISFASAASVVHEESGVEVQEETTAANPDAPDEQDQEIAEVPIEVIDEADLQDLEAINDLETLNADFSEYYRATIESKLTGELAQAALLMNLDETKVAAIRETLEDETEELIKSVSESDDDFPISIDADVHQMLVAELSKDASLAEGLEKFIAASDEMEGFVQNVFQEMILLTFDFAIVLSDDQRQQMAGLIREHWETFEVNPNSGPFYAGAFGGSDELSVVAEALPEQSLKEILTENQLASYYFLADRYAQLGVIGNVIGGAEGSVEDEWLDSLEQWTLDSIALNVAEVNRCCSLTDQQKRKLEIAGKAVASEIVAEKLDAIREPGRGRMEPMYVASVPPGTALLSSDRWVQLLEKTLSDAQMESYRPVIEARQKRYIDNISILITVSLREQIGRLDLAQTRKFAGLIAGNTDPRIPDGLMSTMKAFVEVSEEEMEEFLDDEQIGAIQPFREMMRSEVGGEDDDTDQR